MGSAFFAGLVGGGVMILLMSAARLAGLPVDIAMLLGAFLSGASSLSWLLGIVAHLAIAGVTGLAYGLGFALLRWRPSWRAGLALSAVHVVVGGVLLGRVPASAAIDLTSIPAPGMFLAAFGRVGIVSFVLSHAAFGALVGMLYRPAPVGASATVVVTEETTTLRAA